MKADALLERIERDKSKIVTLCSDLVKIPSEDPPGDTREIATFVCSLLDRHGLPYKIYAPQSHMPNIVARIEGRERGKRLVLNGHLDTYTAGEHARWNRDPFSGEVEDGKLFGRGASDMKAGDTASIMTFLYAAEQQEHLKGELVLTLVSDEETGSQWGVKWLLANVPEFRGDALLNGEPFGPELLIFGEKGVLRLEFTSHGKAAHGAYVHLGDNAIQKMNVFLAELRSLEAMEAQPHELSHYHQAAREAIDDINGHGAADLMERITVNVGTISGGYLVNLVPELCKAEVDIRLPLGVSTAQILRSIDAICDKHPGIEYRITNRLEPSWTPVDDPIVQATLRAAERVKRQKIYPSCSIAADDAAYIRPSHIPCVLYGPRAHQMGAENEYVTVSDLIDTVGVHVLATFDFLGMLG